MTDTTSSAKPQPTEIRIRRGTAALEVDFDDGMRAVLPAEYLRVESPSAEVKGHGANTKTIVAGKANVNIASADPIGHYAIRIRFTDGHETGIFTWAYLHELAREYAPRWQAYLDALASKGLRREPAGARR